MVRFLFLSDSFRHPIQFPARPFDRALRLLLFPHGVHLRQGLGKPAAGPAQNGQRHLQMSPLDLFRARGLRRLRLPLRFQKQFRLGENALSEPRANPRARPCKVSRLARIAAVLHECGGHALTVVRADARHRRQILHRDLRGEGSFALRCWRAGRAITRRAPAAATPSCMLRWTRGTACSWTRYNRSAVPSPTAASLVRARFPASPFAANATAAELRLRPSARLSPRRCRSPGTRDAAIR